MNSLLLYQNLNVFRKYLLFITGKKTLRYFTDQISYLFFLRGVKFMLKISMFFAEKIQ